MHALAFGVRGQGTFQNLGFESANVPIVPTGQSGGFVATSNGIPGWTAYYGPVQQTQIVHNDVSVGSVRVSILGPNWDSTSGIPIIAGSYSAAIQAGFNGVGIVSAAIGQTAQVPTAAVSIQFKAEPISGGSAGQIALALSNVDIPLFPITTTPTYTLYVGDVSAFAGQVEDLRISANPTASYSFSSFVVDSIVFSNQPVPEPGAFGLLCLGALLSACRIWQRRRCK